MIRLTEKGAVAVDQMDDRYKELCRQLGTDPEDWQPEVWIMANDVKYLESDNFTGSMGRHCPVEAEAGRHIPA